MDSGIPKEINTELKRTERKNKYKGRYKKEYLPQNLLINAFYFISIIRFASLNLSASIL